MQSFPVFPLTPQTLSPSLPRPDEGEGATGVTSQEEQSVIESKTGSLLVGLKAFTEYVHIY